MGWCDGDLALSSATVTTRAESAFTECAGDSFRVWIAYIEESSTRDHRGERSRGVRRSTKEPALVRVMLFL